MIFINAAFLLSASAFLGAVAVPAPHAHVEQPARRSLSSRWYHEDDHPAHELFRRQAAPSPPPDSPTVGSPAWAAAYPQSTPDSNAMPQEWKDALNNAVQAGKIPNIAPSTQKVPNTNPTYGNLDPNSPQVCSGTYKCRIPGDTEIWDAPPGVIGISFDDGPLPTSDKLYAFLQQNHVRATHFFIGINIINNWKEFNTAFANQDDIAVHTWTHPYMTTLSNADVVAQLGWTLQLIYNSTGGHLAKFWRPPYGDSDVRVTAIAKEVFGLTTVIWNQDSEDWSLGEAGGTTSQAIAANFQKWLTGPKTPGLIVLEHELSTGTVQAFIDAFPVIQQNNWTMRSIASLDGVSAAYQNALDSTASPVPVALTAGGLDASVDPTQSSSSSLPASESTPPASPSLAPQVASALPPPLPPPLPPSSSQSTTPSGSAGVNNQAKNNGGAMTVRSPVLALAMSAIGLLAGLCVA